MGWKGIQLPLLYPWGMGCGTGDWNCWVPFRRHGCKFPRKTRDRTRKYKGNRTESSLLRSPSLGAGESNHSGQDDRFLPSKTIDLQNMPSHWVEGCRFTIRKK